MQELSVSEASVCSVDMDEMSLIEDDWEAVALLFTVPSTKHTEHCIKLRAQENALDMSNIVILNADNIFTNYIFYCVSVTDSNSVVT